MSCVVVLCSMFECVSKAANMVPAAEVSACQQMHVHCCELFIQAKCTTVYEEGSQRD